MGFEQSENNVGIGGIVFFPGRGKCFAEAGRLARVHGVEGHVGLVHESVEEPRGRLLESDQKMCFRELVAQRVEEAVKGFGAGGEFAPQDGLAGAFGENGGMHAVVAAVDANEDDLRVGLPLDWSHGMVWVEVIDARAAFRVLRKA